MDETMMLTFMYVLIAFIAVLVILGVILIVFLRVILSALSQIASVTPTEETTSDLDEAAAIRSEGSTEQGDRQDADQIAVSEGSDDNKSEYVIENSERIRYDRSYAAKLCQLKKQTKEWYSELKNELLSYENVKARSSRRYETFRIARTVVARITVRGKTLCLLLAVDPAVYTDTKYKVEDLSDSSTADTPTLYRLKSARRVAYAKEMIAELMQRSNVSVDPHYVAKDYFMPYEGDVALMRRGSIKRIVKNTSRKYRIEEIDDEEIAKDEPDETLGV